MTQQQIFDIVYTAFVYSGLPFSVGNANLETYKDQPAPFNICLYHGPGGTGCAIGILLPRKLAKMMDETAVGAIRTALRKAKGDIQYRPFPELASLLDILGDQDPDFLASLQSAHDCLDIDRFKEKMSSIATKFGLTIPEKPVDIDFLEMTHSPTQELDDTNRPQLYEDHSAEEHCAEMVG